MAVEYERYHMKVSFTLPAIVAAVIPVIAHPAVIQAVEATLNGGKQIGDGESTMKNVVKDSHANLTLTFTTRQSITVVTAFKEYCETVVKTDAKAQKLGFAPLTLAGLPVTFKGQEVGAWVARLVGNAESQAKAKEEEDAKAKADAKEAIEATKAQVAKGKAKAKPEQVPA